MATIKQYAVQLWQTHKTVCQKFGVDVSTSDSRTRTMIVSEDVMLGTLMKILVDKGLITNAELTAAYTAVTNATFPPLPPEVVVTSDGPPPADPDLGV